MNIIEARGRLLEFIAVRDSFLLSRDMKELLPDGERSAKACGVMVLALNGLKQDGVIVECPGTNEWVMARPLSSHRQEVSLTGRTSFAIAMLLNRACRMGGDRGNLVDPLAVTEHDIQNLCRLVATAGEEESKEGNDSNRPIGFSV